MGLRLEIYQLHAGDDGRLARCAYAVVLRKQIRKQKCLTGLNGKRENGVRIPIMKL